MCIFFFFKSLLNLLQYCFCFMFWVFWLQGMWDLSSLTWDQTCTPCVERWSLNRWATREVLRLFSSFYCWIAYCSFQFCQFCFRNFRALLLHVHTFIMCTFSWYSDSSVIIRCLSLSLAIFLVFRSLLSDINIAVPALYDYCVHSWFPFLRRLTQLILKGEPRVPHAQQFSLSLQITVHLYQGQRFTQSCVLLEYVCLQGSKISGLCLLWCLKKRTMCFFFIRGRSWSLLLWWLMASISISLDHSILFSLWSLPLFHWIQAKMAINQSALSHF